MAKYSTGGGAGGDEGGACELCGRESRNLRRANVAGADLLVCADCRPHGDNRHADEKREGSESTRDPEERDRDREAARRQARMYDAAKGDSTHWEEHGTDYEDDRLPYLVSGYGSTVERARQDAGLTIEELAEEVDAEADDLLAIEQGRASRAGVGGSVIRTLEERFGIDLVEG